MKIMIRNQQKVEWQMVESAAYGDEKELHHLLEESPELISIDEVRPEAESLVVAVPEFSLPVGSIDLLAFSADGDIAVIECKLATNTEIKRKVIGQVLDYGAHLWELRYEDLDEKIKDRTGESLTDLMDSKLQSPDWDQESFRANVEDALVSGNFILTIVVDEINEELSRIVSFMNVCGKPNFDFAALEMRRFQSDETEMLVPRVFGPVRAAKSKVVLEKRQRWNETTFFEELETRKGEESVAAARRILQWSSDQQDQGMITWWGKGKRSGSFVPYFYHNDQQQQLFAVWTYGTVEIYFQWYKYKAPFDDEAKRIELLEKVNEIEDVEISKEDIEKRPNIRLPILAEKERMEQFLSVYDWVVEEIRKS